MDARERRCEKGAMVGSRGLWVLGASSLVGLSCHKAPAADAPLRVAAASDLAEAFPEVGKAFERASGRAVTFSFNSSGLLAKQIEQGAPFDVFAAANVAFVDDVVRAGACAASSRTIYALGRIALWSRGPAAPPSLGDLTRPEVVRVAIANPDHAPYGKAAKEALLASGVWEAIEKKVVYGENVQQTLQFAQSGNAEVAIVALSLALAGGGRATPIDPSLHAPIRQALVVCRGSGTAAEGTPLARRFVSFTASEEGKRILRRYGFGFPDDGAP